MAGALNKNNFLIWEGEFAPAPVIAQAVEDTVSLVVNAAYYDISPLLNDVSTYDIDPTSLLITFQSNPGNPATWDPITKKLRYYPLPFQAAGEFLALKYKWKDVQGNESNEAEITLTFTERPTGWRGRASSRVCLLDTGVNNGQAMYLELEKYYTDDNSLFLPAEYKDNVDTDPDYIPEFTDLISCPLPAQDTDFKVYNLQNAVPIPTIVRIEFEKNGGGSYAFTIGHTFTHPQPRTFQIPAGLYDSITVFLSGAIVGGDLVLSPGSGGSGDEIVSIATSGQTVAFLNKTMGTDPILTLQT